MAGKKRSPVPNNQPRLIDIEPEPRPEAEKQPRGKNRIARLEERVTHLEADVILASSKPPRAEDDEEDDDEDD